MSESESDSIPRIDKVGYLYETLGWISDGATFEEIREAQIEYRKNLDKENFAHRRSGVRSERKLQKHTSEETFWTNTRASVLELMHLGLVEPSPLPSTKAQLEAHRARRYQVTSEGTQFIALAGQDFWDFQDRFAQMFVLTHPLLQRLLAQLAHRELFVPRFLTDDLRVHFESRRDTPSDTPHLMSVAEDACARVSAAGGPNIAPDRLLVELEPGVKKVWNKQDPTLKNHCFNKIMAKAINDQLLRAMAGLHGIPLNVLDFRAGVALLTGFCALDNSHVLMDRTGWTIWSTSNAPPVGFCREGSSLATKALTDPPWFTRRTLTEFELRDKVIECVLSVSTREGGFALIHSVRAQVCHEHRIHSRSFNELLRKMHRGEITHPAYSIYLDRGGYADLPPSELPFVSSRKDFNLITFIPCEEVNHGTRQQVYS
ncbi:hypothetical protein [Cupriavidus necator]